ncbi:MAG: hypothetical protein QME55_06865 [Brevundimonas sp.]|uniref:hypothetical protein n=1 Tax=Brevundimonas sp. TaxID=1871086 RepID=UPI002606B170|nr:hypothetical protein [Brevundimonas sp.]MDI6624434.1 hypothetical protein [Brevundimonas sp.]MDQ7811510.1 hypothetical protein [Brevundimonas sp.]
MAPVEVSGEQHGRLRSYILAEALEPTANFVLQGLVWLTLAVLVVVLVDLVARGRFRNISSTLALMLAALGPLLGVYGAANILMSASLDPQYMQVVPGSLGPSALLVATGMLCGCIGVVLAAVLRIVPAKRRSPLPEPLDQPRVTRP